MRKQAGDLLRALALSILVMSWMEPSAHAQEPPYDPAIDVQLFDLSPGPKSFMSVGDGSLSHKKQFSLDFLLTFLTDPFVIYNVDENQEEIREQRTDVVSSIFAGQLVGAYGLTRDLQLGVNLPLIFSLTGDGLDPNTGDMASGGLQATGFGDMRVELKGQLVRRSSVAAAWTAGLSLPTSFGAGSNNFLGDDLPSFRGGLAAHWDAAQGRLRVGANVGALLRKPRKIYATEVGQQLTYGAGAAFKVTESFSLIGEAFGRTGLTAMNFDASPLEIGGGVRAQATQSFSILAGGGIGVLSGIGSPGLRFVVSIGYAPDYGDTDKDGIDNMSDKCPLLPEDRDGFEDSDGCPDDDNDGDRREDSVDKCPNDKEDLDGFEDEDGCPEADNDADGILDADDRCPLDAEDGRAPFATDGCPADKRDSDDDGVSDLMDECPEDFEDEDGFEDWDGCPEADNDKDGIADSDDACPLCPEDSDGFDDADGCPDLDNDNDLIADREDQCPDEAEVINGNSDDDGCPDGGGTAVATLDGNLLRLNSEVRFSSSDEVRNRRELILVARVMRMQANVRRWRIVAAARPQSDDEATRAKSQAQADAVKAILVEAGLGEDEVEAIGAVSTSQTLVFAVLETGEKQLEDFVCPAELSAKERSRPDPAVVPVAPAPTSSAIASPPASPGPKAAPAGKPNSARTSTMPAQFTALQGVQPRLALNRDKAQFASGTESELDAIAVLLLAHPNVGLEVHAHTDNRKGDAAQGISQDQAQLIVDYLAGKGVQTSRLKAVGRGMTEPVGDNKSSEGRSDNRRIELRFSIQ